MITIVKNRTDPDQRDYFSSNNKIRKGFKVNIIDDGIVELLNVLRYNKIKIINNY